MPFLLSQTDQESTRIFFSTKQLPKEEENIFFFPQHPDAICCNK